MDAKPTDCILLQCTLADPSGLGAAAQATCAEIAQRLLTPATVGRMAFRASENLVYVYFPLGASVSRHFAAIEFVASEFQKYLPQASQVRVSRLQTQLTPPAHSQGQTPSHHYVVETDPEQGWAEEIFRWYDGEHLPGLAAVPGCISARRMLNHDSGPLSLACYDLTSPAVLTAPEWLAVRHTAWSDIARPHFTNTLRTMFEVVAN